MDSVARSREREPVLLAASTWAASCEPPTSLNTLLPDAISLVGVTAREVVAGLGRSQRTYLRRAVPCHLARPSCVSVRLGQHSHRTRRPSRARYLLDDRLSDQG